LDWDKLAEKLPKNLRLVVYTRSNKVKQAISFIRSKELISKCGKSVLVNRNCTIDEKIEIKPITLKHNIIRAIAIDDYMLKVAYKLAEYLENWFYRLTYEEMLGDSTALDRLLDWAGFESVESSDTVDKCEGDCSKDFSDDLRSVISNYEEVESWLARNFPCILGQFHEKRAGHVMPSVHDTCSPEAIPNLDPHLNVKHATLLIGRKSCCPDGGYNCTCT